MIKFFKDAISEIHNVTWPTKKHYMHISMVAIIFTLAAAVFIGFMDYAFNKAVKIQTGTENTLDVSDIKVKTKDGKDAKVEVTTDKK